jgi:hypothetical protein
MRLLFRLVLALSLLAVPGAPLARTILAAIPISRMDLPWWHSASRKSRRNCGETSAADLPG